MRFVVLLEDKIDNKENKYVKYKVYWKEEFPMESKAVQREGSVR